NADGSLTAREIHYFDPYRALGPITAVSADSITVNDKTFAITADTQFLQASWTAAGGFQLIAADQSLFVVGAFAGVQGASDGAGGANALKVVLMPMHGDGPGGGDGTAGGGTN